MVQGWLLEAMGMSLTEEDGDNTSESVDLEVAGVESLPFKGAGTSGSRIWLFSKSSTTNLQHVLLFRKEQVKSLCFIFTI